MFDHMHITVLIVAFSLDCFLGDPRYPLHPVRLIGNAAAFIKNVLFEIQLRGRFSGFLLTIVMILAVLNIYIILRSLLGILHPAVAFPLDIFFFYSSIALKDMVRHAIPIATSLQNEELENARANVQMIVGRNCSTLDKHGITRATVESVSESFVDGFFAPVFWYVTAAVLAPYLGISPTVAGVMAVLIYRTVNTLDSIIGYKSNEYRLFGSFAARLDDVLNFIPARLSILVLIPAAFICRLNTKQAVRIFFRDRKKHSSPNSAHVESFVAGALELKLGGPTEYPHGTVAKPWLGCGSTEPDPETIMTTCKLITLAGWITILSFVMVLSS